ncbi:unnamed protein product, partial [Urochloa humidicola]
NIGFDTSNYTNAPKRMVHETSPSSSNLEDSHFEKIRRGTTNFSAANSMKAKNFGWFISISQLYMMNH